MSEPLKVRRRVSGENYVHRTLWQVVIRAGENAAARPTGSFYDDLTAMVFAFHAFEALLNLLGQRLAPDLWADERNRLRTFRSRLDKVVELCELPVINVMERPFSTVWFLKNLRDQIAHGKIEKFGPIFEMVDVDAPLAWTSSAFVHQVTWGDAAKCVADVHAAGRVLHSAALLQAASTADLGDDPFLGLHSISTCSDEVIR